MLTPPWKILHVDLEEPARHLAPVPAYRALYAVFWWRGTPLGHLEIPAEALPLAPAQWIHEALPRIAPAVGDRLFADGFRAPLPECRPRAAPAPALEELLRLERPLSRLRTDHRPSERWAARTSVVICTRSRVEALARCLDSLRDQDPPPLEAIVVDNDPKETARRIVERFPDVRYVQEPRPGLSVARNAGIRHGKGEVIAFTDDDAVVHPGWIGRLASAFEDPDVMVATGLALPAELETESQVTFEKRMGFHRGYRAITYDFDFFREQRARGVHVWRIGAGVNMAVRREAIEAVGGFDERLGAGAAGCAEDSELWYRVLARGWKCRYEPHAVVSHHHRRERWDLEEQARLYMRGHTAALLVQWERHRHWGNLVRLFVVLPGFYAKELLRWLVSRESRHRSLWSHEVAGFLSGFPYYVRQGRRASRVRGPKRPLGAFLRRNPFPQPLTAGLFYREKMRAIHHVAPDEPFEHVLEVGGGQGGLTTLLYPSARVTNLDLDRGCARAPVNRALGGRFVCGDATSLPFEDESFDAVTLFDVLEHIPEDARAVKEALRVLKPGGALLVSTPNERWRFPYYPALRRICPTEREIWDEWGHVRSGYSLPQLEELFGSKVRSRADFISPVTVIGHDFTFSRLPFVLRALICLGLAPVSWAGYWLHGRSHRGTETASLWRKDSPHGP